MQLHMHTASGRKALSDTMNDKRLPARLGPWICGQLVHVTDRHDLVNGIDAYAILDDIDRYGYFLFPAEEDR